ncbi:hypothetical protein [Neisseria sicca]|uniref:hypothetical protein n=1 Tax=Neisseria sicca TaxID=490 RepID=UPI0021C10EB7|nr:hypothetical protein [Neisseria sicca]
MLLLHELNQLLAKFGFARPPAAVDDHRGKVDGRGKQPDDVFGYRLTVEFVLCIESGFF